MWRLLDGLAQGPGAQGRQDCVFAANQRHPKEPNGLENMLRVKSPKNYVMQL